MSKGKKKHVISLHRHCLYDNVSELYLGTVSGFVDGVIGTENSLQVGNVLTGVAMKRCLRGCPIKCILLLPFSLIETRVFVFMCGVFVS